MRRAVLWLRSVSFVGAIYALMGVMGLVGAPVVLWRVDWTRTWMKIYARTAIRLAGVLCGLTVELRGPVPDGPVLVVAKHQSLLDVLVLFAALPEPRFVMKRELMWAPFFGLFARRAGALPIDRRGGAATMAAMVDAFRGVAGQVTIYPQGTRVPPGTRAPYRRGAVRLYEALGRPAVLVATNAGHFWPRRGVLRHPGRAVVHFFETVQPGLGPEAVAALFETRIEAASDALSREACAGG